MKKLLSLLLALMLPLSFASAAEEKEMFTGRDCDPSYDAADAIRITLDGTSASFKSRAVKQNGSAIHLLEEGVYVLSGTLTDGMIIVDAPDTAKVQLVLDGAHITSMTSAALYVRSADKVFVTLAEGTQNTLENGGKFVAIDEKNIDGAVFARENVTFNGTGSLTVVSPAGHGIVCKDDLKFTGGAYTVEAASRAIDANDSIRIREAAITATAGKDGLRTQDDEDDPAKGFIYMESGVLDVRAEGDGVSAGTTLDILGGAVTVVAGGGSENGDKRASSEWGRFGHRGGPDWNDRQPQESPQSAATEGSTSMKGLKAAGGITITGGVFDLNTADDAIHGNASITVSGGDFTIASGDDAIHSEDTLTISGGNICVTESYEGLEALHLAVSGGDIRLVSSDDGLNSAGGKDESGVSGGRDGRFGGGRRGLWRSTSSDGTIVISGGTLFIQASGDGIDANGSLSITGGHVTVMGPTQGDTAVLDYDLDGVISGGTFIGTGARMMAQTLTGSAQGVLSVSASRQAADARILITDADGATLLDHTPELPYQILIFSSSEVVSGQTYTVTVGDASSGITAD